MKKDFHLTYIYYNLNVKMESEKMNENELIARAKMELIICCVLTDGSLKDLPFAL